MGRSQETFQKKEVRNKKEKKRREKELKRKEKRDKDTSGSLNDMIAYVDDFGNIVDTPPETTGKKEEINADDIEIGVPKQADRAEMDPIRKGVVTFFNDDKGYGFIKDSETKESVFVHVNNTEEDIKENNMVSFEVEMGPKGPSAIKVKLNK
jgi:cold shock CspA family protein